MQSINFRQRPKTGRDQLVDSDRLFGLLWRLRWLPWTNSWYLQTRKRMLSSGVTFIQFEKGPLISLDRQTRIWQCNKPKPFFLIKPTDALISQLCFVKKLYMFQAVPLPIIRSFPLYIRHWCMSCRFDDSFQARPVPSWSRLKTVIKSAWHTPVPNVRWKIPDDGQRNCPKHVQFLDKINLEN